MDKERLEGLLNNSHKCYGTENLILESKLVKELNRIIKYLNDEVMCKRDVHKEKRKVRRKEHYIRTGK